MQASFFTELTQTDGEVLQAPIMTNGETISHLYLRRIHPVIYQWMVFVNYGFFAPIMGPMDCTCFRCHYHKILWQALRLHKELHLLLPPPTVALLLE